MGMKKRSLMGIILSLSLFAIIILTVKSSILNADANISAKNRSNVDENLPNYSINKEGQTYGHGPYPSGSKHGPDLIKAEGENGVIGYVKSSDMETSVSSPEEALTDQKSIKNAGYKSIPLYDSDGTTVIGEFKMYSSKGD
ncbi:hypothetical protein PPM_p0149 (plasmid) [Paenibacillus polymyxa M1]|uniref:hypothetical protein n=1 Tax=Paenibacillus polymyxa TaxID=1406 RepID=UPI00021BBB81|nr:hypothetical protein [Paenibacillus polymyxa]CCC86299.1 hypothetical protein PPM_p0149 [Paenibacillus polymyxa M1]